MAKRRKLRNVRPKAIFGLPEAGATLAAAGIQAAATITGAGIGAAAQAAAASQQADSIERQAEEQARALEQQNENNNRLQEKQVEIQKETSNKIADAITANQMNLQMLAGNESAKERAAEGRIMVKRGGNIKKRMRNGGYNPTVPLTGGYNMPFKVTDGGGVAYQGSTPEGYDLYELYGDNHEHYHKTRNGKYKSGVGIRFANGGEVEGEGNQSTGQGEYLLVTPDNGYFISKHTINGVNPAGLINRGVHPVDAYNIQEAAKGRKTSFAKRLRCGGRVKRPDGGDTWYDNLNFWGNIPSYLFDTYAGNVPITQTFIPTFQNNNTFNGVANTQLPVNSGDPYKQFGDTYITPQTVSSENGVSATWTPNNPMYSGSGVEVKPPIASDILKPLNEKLPLYDKNGNVQSSSGKSNFWNFPNGALAVSTAANLAGAVTNHIGNLMGQHRLSDAYNKAANTMTDAYNSLRQIDANGLLDYSQFRGAMYLPAIRSANVNVNPQLQDINRANLRQQRSINNNTLSSAARLNRSAFFENSSQDARSKVYADQANREEDIKQKNNQMINQASAANVQSQNELRKSLANLRLELAKYNNDIANERILGAANAQSQMGINTASAKANAYNATSQSFANALNTIGNNYYGAWQTQYKADQELQRALAGADSSARLQYLLSNDPGKQGVLDNYNAMLTLGQYSNAQQLKNRYPQYF